MKSAQAEKATKHHPPRWVKARRTVRRTVTKLIEVLSSRPLFDQLKPYSVWLALRPKCYVCGKPFKVGEALALATFREDGRQQSGGCHPACIEEDDG